MIGIHFGSNGHISPVFYSEKRLLSSRELATFRKLKFKITGHPTTHEGLQELEWHPGSLGQGMSVAIGAAQAKKLNNDNHLVFAL